MECAVNVSSSSVKKELLSKTDHTTFCGWKGNASYYSINLDSTILILYSRLEFQKLTWSSETELKNAAWYYPEPYEKAKNIKDYVAFCECHIIQSYFAEGLVQLYSSTMLMAVFIRQEYCDGDEGVMGNGMFGVWFCAMRGF